MIPQNPIAEEALLGALLFAPSTIAVVRDVLHPDAFFTQANQNLYKACVAFPGDIQAIAQLADPKDPVKLVSRIAELTERVIGSGDVEQHLEMILDAWRRRRLIALANDIVTKVKTPINSVAEVQAHVERELTDICHDVLQSNVLTLSEAVDQFRNQLHEPHNAISLQVPEMDRLLAGGLRPKTFTVIAARPSMGKTWVGNFVASAIASSQDRPAVIFSAEMSSDQLAMRFIATATGVDSSAILERKVTEDELMRLHSVDFTQKPIYIDDTPGASLTTSHIGSLCQRVRREHGSIGVVIVDYLQLLGDRGSNNRHGEVGRFSGYLKDLSKELDCPVVALAQLNRGVEGRQEKRPILADLKESGDIEQDASTVVFLFREDYYSDDKPKSGEWVNLELIFAKNRSGPCGTAIVSFCPATGEISSNPPITEY